MNTVSKASQLLGTVGTPLFYAAGAVVIGIALHRYLERVDNGIRRAFEDGDDRKDAFGVDRQGLGLSRERELPEAS